MKKLTGLMLSLVLLCTLAVAACGYEIDEGIKKNLELVYTLVEEEGESYYIVGKTMDLASLELTKADVDALDYEKKAEKLGVYGGEQKQIVIPAEHEGKPVRGIGVYAFYLSEAEEIVLPETVTEIALGAFSYCSSLKRITVGSEEAGSSLNKIGSYAFSSSAALSVVTLHGETVPEIGNLEAFDKTNPFYGTSFPAVLVPAQVKPLYETASNWDRYTNYFATTSSEFSDGQIVDGDTLVKYAGSSKTVTVPEDVEYIGTYAFKNTEVTEVSVPSTVKEIGRQAFADCKQLLSVSYADSSALEIIGNSAFIGCSSLKTAVIPSSVNMLMDGAFSRCIALDTVYIDSPSFTMCTAVFDGCTALENVYYIGTKEQFASLTVLSGNDSFLSLKVVYDYNNVEFEEQ